MGFIEEDVLSGLGIGYSITGLALALPVCFIFRTYFRFLDHLQLFYLFYLGLGNSLIMFSKYLSDSWVLFDQNFFVFCNEGDLLCTIGFPLSFTSCLMVFLIALKIIVLFEKCRKQQIRYEPVYSFFKGFWRWTYVPLTYYSLYFII